jgi:hypothetical protein
MDDLLLAADWQSQRHPKEKAPLGKGHLVV